jgi:hypothetical protein
LWASLAKVLRRSCGKFTISNQCAILFDNIADSLGRNAFLPDVSLKAIFVIRDGSKGMPFYPEESQWQRTLFFSGPA